MKSYLNAWSWKVTFMNNVPFANLSVANMFLWLISTNYLYTLMIICIYTWKHEILRNVAYVSIKCFKCKCLYMNAWWSCSCYARLTPRVLHWPFSNVGLSNVEGAPFHVPRIYFHLYWLLGKFHEVWRQQVTWNDKL